jgi:hypothetical protein
MSDLLSRLDGGEVLGFIAIVGGLSVLAISILGSCWSSARRAEHRTRQLEIESALKKDMLDRHMSAEDIERVLNAGQTKPARCWRERALAHRS